MTTTTTTARYRAQTDPSTKTWHLGTEELGAKCVCGTRLIEPDDTRAFALKVPADKRGLPDRPRRGQGDVRELQRNREYAKATAAPLAEAGHEVSAINLQVPPSARAADVPGPGTRAPTAPPPTWPLPLTAPPWSRAAARAAPTGRTPSRRRTAPAARPPPRPPSEPPRTAPAWTAQPPGSARHAPRPPGDRPLPGAGADPDGRRSSWASGGARRASRRSRLLRWCPSGSPLLREALDAYLRGAEA